MPVLGIVLCESLELEFACLLAAAPNIAGIAVLEDARSRHFIEALETRGCCAVSGIPHIASFRAGSADGLEIVVRVLELALHRKREILRHALREAAGELSTRVDALLLGYGCCGGALADPSGTLAVDVPVFLPMDRGRPADDCVSVCIGGRDRYYTEQRRVPGTFFMTPEWTYHWRKLFHGGFPGPVDAAPVRRLFAGYERSLYVVTPAMSEEEMEGNAAEFNRLLGLRREACTGTLALLSGAWQSARRFVERK